MKLIVKFNPRIEFSDSPTGFFGGLSEVFDQLAREEVQACSLEGLDAVSYPSFGYHSSDADRVRAFYAEWGGFATKKSFSWKDTYKYSDAPDRRVRRLMERENKRLREDAIREFNDAVRSLVAFAKKRDPRYKKTAQSEEDRQRLLRESAAAQAARSRKANNEKLDKFMVPEWAQAEEEPENEFGSESESESEQDYYECVVCNKAFKSERQFEAHERSKKHKKALKQLRYEMEVDDRQLNLNPSKYGGFKEHDRNDYICLSDMVVKDKPGDTGENNDRLNDCETNSHEPVSHSDCQNNIPVSSPQDFGLDKTEDLSINAEEQRNFKANTSEHSLQKSPVIEEVLAETSLTDEPVIAKKPGKAKQKRAKRAAAETQSQEMEFVCSRCQSSFPSRSKLFSHIRELGHAELVVKPQKKGNRGKNKR